MIRKVGSYEVMGGEGKEIGNICSLVVWYFPGLWCYLEGEGTELIWFISNSLCACFGLGLGQWFENQKYYGNICLLRVYRLYIYSKIKGLLLIQSSYRYILLLQFKAMVWGFLYCSILELFSKLIWFKYVKVKPRYLALW